MPRIDTCCYTGACGLLTFTSDNEGSEPFQFPIGAFASSVDHKALPSWLRV